ncbi:hypothetical protein [Serinicoccus profundi]|uniref:hypothetical protein n=1 Tax=Serinicoccus profundi TaxID=1078471 RepID=UPI000255F774|nr:hypothetical protein [Serinicoccus profundi]
MSVRIDPDGVLAMSAATLAAAQTAGEVAEDVQRAVERVDHLVGRTPHVRSAVRSVGETLTAAAGLAYDHATHYVDDVRPLRELAEAGYWLPDLSALGWQGEESVLGNVERISRSDEFGAFVLGTGESLLERYRTWRLHVPRRGPSAGRALGEISELITFADDVEVRPGRVVVQGRPWTTSPSGLLVPEPVERGRLSQGRIQGSAARRGTLIDDATYAPWRRLVPDPTIGRPPAWARHGGRGLIVVGSALSLYDAGASQWEHDQRHHPEYSDAQRVASTGWSVATEGGGAVAGGIAGGKVGAGIGAAVGSVVPGLGTGVGAVVGGVVGGAVGAFVGSKAGKALGTGLREGAEAVWDSVFG